MFNQLSALDASKTAWRIKVRVTRMWPSISKAAVTTASLKGYNLILLDDELKNHEGKIKEGGVYVISNFYTKEALGSLKPVSSKYLINFSPTTSVEPVQDDFMIPKYKFEFVDLSDLYSVASAYANVDYPEFTADVIGVVEDFEKLSKIKTVYGERDIVKFRITDGRDSARVTVWGPLAIKTDARYKELVERPVIVILSSIKLKNFHTTVQISTLPSTKIYFDEDYEVVLAMKQRLQEEGYVPGSNIVSSPSQSETSSDLVIETVTLKQLSKKTSTDFLKRNFLCKIKVKSVEQADNWWYNCCTKTSCYGEVAKMEGKFKCLKCSRIYPVPLKSYKIIILGEDEEEAFNFVLLDCAAKRLVGKTVTKLIADKLNDEAKNGYPQEIQDLTGRDITLRLELCEDNILLESTVYYATDAFDPNLQSRANSETTVIPFNLSESADISVAETSDYGSTPGSARSTTKKIKMEPGIAAAQE